MDSIKRRSDCPVNLSLEVFGDKWTLLVLRDIIFFGHRHFRDFVQLESISTNILTERLKRLVDNGILKKEIDKDNQSSYIYSITQRGLDLVPIVIDMYHWGAIHVEGNNADVNYLKRVTGERNKVIKEITQKLKKEHHVK
ncbi:MAG: helix-turn-helix domain-containing protein [Flavipsychrobacter sp.]